MPINGVFKTLCHACNESLHVTGYCWNAACKLAGTLQKPIYKAEPLSEAKEAESAQASEIRGKEGKVIVTDEFESAHDRATAFDAEALRLSEAAPDQFEMAWPECVEPKQLPLRPQHIFAIHRDENNDFCLCLYFDRVPTDDEMRMAQDILNLSFKASYLKKHHDAAGIPQEPPKPVVRGSKDELLVDMIDSTLREVTADKAGQMQFEVRLLRKAMLAFPTIGTIAELDTVVKSVTRNDLESHWNNYQDGNKDTIQ